MGVGKSIKEVMNLDHLHLPIEVQTPPAPAPGEVCLFVDADGHFKQLDATGDVADLASSGGGMQAGDSVQAETSYGQAASAGSASTYSRSNHTHGSPALSDAAPLALGNPSPGLASTPARSDHVHPQTGLALSTHNHDGTYSPVDHSHSGYSPTGHGHAFSEITGTAATAQIPNHDIITKHSGFPGGTANFLRADGTFAAPPSGSGSSPWTTIIKPADTARVNNTLAADPDLQVALAAGNNYTIRLRVYLITNATADARYQLTFSGTTARVRRQIVRTATGDIPAFVTAGTAFDAAPVVVSTTGLNPYVEEYIVVQVLTAGTLAFQWAQATTNVGATSVLEGSTLEWAVT